MRIAFISYEYAGRASGGGIGTYVRHAAEMLAGRGHEVEVFTHGATAGEAGAQVVVHGAAADRAGFARAIAPVFAARHAEAPFDVAEGPEYGADAAAVARAFPDLPLVVKLHTPAFLISEINHGYLSLPHKARFMLGGLRRGRLAKPYWTYAPQRDPERLHALAADEITAPSTAILDLLAARWGLPAERLARIPHPFVAAAELLAAPVETMTRRITFLGRLEARKGVIELAQAIPRVLARAPQARFRLIGRSLPHPATGEDMAAHVRRVVGPGAAAVEFVDGVPHADVPRLLCDTDICVFPSVWEASGYVCNEAMAAARGVIASAGSGMAEIVQDGRTGRLVPPRDPDALADAIVAMLDAPEARQAMGRAARAQVVAAYAPQVIGPLQEASYARAITRARGAQALRPSSLGAGR
jgi:glycogen(starch) synthase